MTGCSRGDHDIDILQDHNTTFHVLSITAIPGLWSETVLSSQLKFFVASAHLAGAVTLVQSFHCLPGLLVSIFVGNFEAAVAEALYLTSSNALPDDIAFSDLLVLVRSSLMRNMGARVLTPRLNDGFVHGPGNFPTAGERATRNELHDPCYADTS